MQWGRTALYVAAENDRSENVELLLEHKASIDLQTKVMRTWAWGGRGVAW